MENQESLKINHTGRKVFPYKGYLVPVANRRSRYIQYYQIAQFNPKFTDKLNALVDGDNFTIEQQRIGIAIKHDLYTNWELTWNQFRLVMNQRQMHLHESEIIPKKRCSLKRKRKHAKPHKSKTV